MQTAPLHEWLQQAMQQSPQSVLRAQPGALILSLVRRAVLEGVLTPGVRVPSSRELAAELGVARNTVVAVYDQLKAEGMLVAGQGSGTFVCRVQAPLLRAPRDAQGALPPAASARPRPPPPGLSSRGLNYQRHPVHTFWRPQPFCSGHLDLDLFPIRIWNRLYRRHLGRDDRSWLQPSGEGGGERELREAIAEHIRTSRGVRCEASQVILTDGTVESLELVVRLLTDPGDIALIENPCYWGASQVLTGHGLSAQPLDVDGEGLPLPPPGLLPRPPRLVYLTPSNQFPMGHVMSLSRRLAWLHYAQAHDALLLEDDYDSEYRYTGKPFPSLQGLRENGHVIYLGTFSKTLYPGLRMAYLVVPAHLQDIFSTAAGDFYRDGDVLTQRVLADFIREGHYAAHVRATRREYALRREALLQALQQELAAELQQGRITISGGAMGMHLTLLLPDEADDRAIAHRSLSAGAAAMPLSVYCPGIRRSGLVLSYAAVPPAQMLDKVRRLVPAVRAQLMSDRP